MKFAIQPRPSRRARLVATASAVTLTACALLAAGKTNASAGERRELVPVEIQFALQVGDEPALCGKTYHNVGTAHADMSLQDARIYVSAFRLIGPDGIETPLALDQDGVWQHENLALLDFEDATGACNGNPVTNVTIRGEAPKGEYSGLAFEIGVPEAMNHQDPTLAAPPLNQSSLSWPWRFGYKHTTIDLETAAPAGKETRSSGFSIHLGATDCEPGPIMTAPSAACKNQNRPSVVLAEFDPARESVVIDLGALLAETDITTNASDTASGCMSSPEDADCEGIFKRAGLKGEPQQFVKAK